MTKLKPGKIVVGSITGVEPYGAFVNLNEYYNGLIHISEISNGFVRDINDFVDIGEKIYVQVIDVDDEMFQVKLSIKDIDYKMEQQSKRKIRETKRGFNPLKEKLPEWVHDKLLEMNNN